MTHHDDDIGEELQAHLEHAVDDLARSGVAPEEARRRAIASLGGVTQTAEIWREARGVPFLEKTMQDLRYALRMLRKTPGFAAAAILTLALGIGANTAMFSVLNAVLLRPLEYPRPEQVMKIVTSYPGVEEFWVSAPEYQEFRRWTHAFASVGAYNTGEANLAAPDRPQRIRLMAVSDNLLTTLGVNAQLGRAWFEGNEAVAGGRKVAVLSHDLWQTTFGGDPALVGRTIDVDGVQRVVVGIMPRGFDVADERVQIWQPMIVPPNPGRGSHNLLLIGRLAGGVTPQAARAEMDNLLANWRSRAFGAQAASDSTGIVANGLHAPGPDHPLRIDPLRTRIVANATTAVWVLQGAVVLVLLIACANLSTLLLSRAESRRREYAIRSALGAGRRRMFGQALVEGCLLSGTGAVLGIGFAIAGLRVMVAAYPDSLPRSSNVSVDLTVLAFTAAIAVLTGVVFGLAPLIHLSPDLHAGALKDSAARTAGGRHALRRGLVAAEVALALALVAGAGLLLRTVSNLSRADAGFDRTHLVTFGISLPAAKYPTPQHRRNYFRQLATELASTPGVARVAFAGGLPPLRTNDSNTVTIEGFEGRENGAWNTIDFYQIASADYLETMGIPIIEGRNFTPSDTGGPPLALINQTMARSIWPGQSPISHRLRSCCNPNQPWITVIGVVGDVKQAGVDRKTGTELYFSADRNPLPFLNVVMRTTLDAGALAGPVQQIVNRLDPSLPVIRLRGMDEVFDGAISRQTLLARLLTAFAALSLLLAAIGTYGVLSYMVNERRREIGIRMALGATRPDVLKMVLSQGLKTTAAGLAAGIAITLAIGRVLSSLLFGVSPSDPVTIITVAVLMGGVAAASCYVPGYAATRVDPMIALREE